MQKVYYAVRCWCHTEKETQTINARKRVSSRSGPESRPAKVLQSENQSKEIKANIGLGFLIRRLEHSESRNDKSGTIL